MRPDNRSIVRWCWCRCRSIWTLFIWVWTVSFWDSKFVLCNISFIRMYWMPQLLDAKVEFNVVLLYVRLVVFCLRHFSFAHLFVCSFCFHFLFNISPAKRTCFICKTNNQIDSLHTHTDIFYSHQSQSLRVTQKDVYLKQQQQRQWCMQYWYCSRATTDTL